jgi:hypothetical protein
LAAAGKGGWFLINTMGMTRFRLPKEMLAQTAGIQATKHIEQVDGFKMLLFHLSS